MNPDRQDRRSERAGECSHRGSSNTRGAVLRESTMNTRPSVLGNAVVGGIDKVMGKRIAQRPTRRTPGRGKHPRHADPGLLRALRPITQTGAKIDG